MTKKSLQKKAFNWNESCRVWNTKKLHKKKRNQLQFEKKNNKSNNNDTNNINLGLKKKIWRKFCGKPLQKNHSYKLIYNYE